MREMSLDIRDLQNEEKEKNPNPVIEAKYKTG